MNVHSYYVGPPQSVHTPSVEPLSRTRSLERYYSLASETAVISLFWNT